MRGTACQRSSSHALAVAVRQTLGITSHPRTESQYRGVQQRTDKAALTLAMVGPAQIRLPCEPQTATHAKTPPVRGAPGVSQIPSDFRDENPYGSATAAKP
jgi:hypothetical protein